MPIIASLHLYPVKGCRAVDVKAIEISPRGLLVGDREMMIVDASSGRFISQRHEPMLTQLVATPLSGGIQLSWQGKSSMNVFRQDTARARQVIVWDDIFEADDAGDTASEWISSAIDFPARLVWLRPTAERILESFWAGADNVATSFADMAPVLLTNNASLDDLNERRRLDGQRPVSMSRFRPNIVVTGLPAFGEDDVAALQTTDRQMTITLIKPCARCSVTELDPQTGDAPGDEVLRSLAGFRTIVNRRGSRGIMFGQNAIVRSAQPRPIRVGEALEIVA